MDFGLSQEQELLRDSLRGWLADELPIEHVRETIESDADTGPAVRAGLAAQGIFWAVAGLRAWPGRAEGVGAPAP